jgi:iron complex outermembrane recepter protein
VRNELATYTVNKNNIAQTAPKRDLSIRTATCLAVYLISSQVIADEQAQPAQASSGGTIAEIIVTAQKREERLQDVPVPLSVISGEELATTNTLRIQDYAASVPGLSVAPAPSSFQFLSIRGISTANYTNPKVSVLVDDVPVGSSTELGGGLIIPDVDPGDLERVEVLRGPQGTLYGASSLGGLIKFVTVDPTTSAANARVEAGLSGVYHGDQPGYNFRASGNQPLSDTFAIRASGFARQDPGYIDDPVHGARGINESHIWGGRLAALWWPADALTVKLSAVYQDYRADGQSIVDPLPGYGPLDQFALPGAGWQDRKLQLYNATVNAKLAGVNLTSVSAYSRISFKDTANVTLLIPFFVSLGQQAYGTDGLRQTDDNFTDKFTQEIRLAASIGSRIDWLLGGFYNHESTGYVQSYYGADTATGAGQGVVYSAVFPSNFREYAAFADLTFHVTGQFDVQVGARESHLDERIAQTFFGDPYDLVAFGQPSPVMVPEVRVRANAFTYLFTPRFKFSDDLMVYARLASGYGAGGPNFSPGAPRQYAPDKTKNYEVGLKGDLLEHALSIDTSIYYIDYRDIQLVLQDPLTLLPFNGNVSRAKSEGVELSIQSRPLTGLSLSGWVSYDNAVLTEGFPPAALAYAYGVPGDRLPFTSRWSGNVSVQQEFPLGNDLTGFAGGSVSYVGDRVGVFLATPVRQHYPGYARTDLNVGVRIRAWTVNAYVNNVTDRREALQGGLDIDGVSQFQILPRNFGLNVIRRF